MQWFFIDDSYFVVPQLSKSNLFFHCSASQFIFCLFVHIFSNIFYVFLRDFLSFIVPVDWNNCCAKETFFLFNSRIALSACFNDTHKEKLFYSIHYKNGCLAPSYLFYILHNQLSFIYSIISNGEYRSLKNVIHEIHSNNERLFLSTSFMIKFELVFVLTLENAFT